MNLPYRNPDPPTFTHTCAECGFEDDDPDMFDWETDTLSRELCQSCKIDWMRAQAEDDDENSAGICTPDSKSNEEERPNEQALENHLDPNHPDA